MRVCVRRNVALFLSYAIPRLQKANVPPATCGHLARGCIAALTGREQEVRPRARVGAASALLTHRWRWRRCEPLLPLHWARCWTSRVSCGPLRCAVSAWAHTASAGDNTIISQVISSVDLLKLSRMAHAEHISVEEHTELRPLAVVCALGLTAHAWPDDTPPAPRRSLLRQCVSDLSTAWRRWSCSALCCRLWRCAAPCAHTAR